MAPIATEPRARTYRPLPGSYDEAVAADGSIREHYVDILGALEGEDLAELALTMHASLRRDGVRFGAGIDSRVFAVDPVPRVLAADEWAPLAAGLAQRVRALNRFVADVYGAREVVEAGVIPATVLESARLYEPLAAELPPPPGGVFAGVAGFDVVRGADGRFLALEDNLRTPSGLAYAVAARRAHRDAGAAGGPPSLAEVDRAPATLAGALRAADPHGGGDPAIALLSDGHGNAAFYEHRWLAQELGVPLVTPHVLEPSGDRLYARLPDGRRQQLDVLYRRTDADRLTRADGRRLTALGALLVEPLRAGNLTCVNAFGAGIGDDKLVHAYVEDMIRHYLGEEPLLGSVPTHDLGPPGERVGALRRLPELVVKPRAGEGGRGVVVCAHADAADVAAAADAIRRGGNDLVAQETVSLSTHPTVIAGRLEPRHVDLRPFVISGAGGAPAVVPGGLTRVAFDAGALVVNSSQNGGAKDTWVVS
jgi:carboxylate-amine ligase